MAELVEVGSEDWLRRIEFASERERETFAEARFGETVRQFLVSEVGRYLHGRAVIRLEEIKDALLDLDPDEPGFDSEFRKLKAESYYAENFMKYLADALQNGELAAQRLMSGEDEDLLE